MGNNQVTPAENAQNAYIKFIESHEKDAKANKRSEYVETLNYEFGLFLEDLMVNNAQHQMYSDDGKSIEIGCLCLLHTIFSSTLNDDLHISKDVYCLFSYYNNGFEPYQALLDYIQSKYCWDGSSFYEWTGTQWKACEQSSINCTDFVSVTRCNIVVSTFGSTDKFVIDAVQSINLFLENITAFAADFKNNLEVSLNKRFSKLTGVDDTIKSLAQGDCFELLKTKVTKFNRNSKLVPCHSGVVKLNDASMRKYKKTDYFTVTLPFDPAMANELTELSKTFLEEFQCDSSTLASTIVSCGGFLEPTLTIISGPSGSGKSTLLDVTRTLYGPYATNNSQKDINYEQVRTCFIDDASFLDNEENVKNHPCKHLVVSCNSSKIGEKFADRHIRRVILSDVISNPIPNVVEKLTTRKQLGSVLGWSLAHYDVSECNPKIQRELTSLIVNMLMEDINNNSEESD